MLALALIALLFCTAPLVNGQALSGINGTVTDQTGAVVQNAKVTVTNTGTGVVKSAVTSAAGTYEVTDLLPGRYTVSVEVPGFETSVHNDVNIEVARFSTVDATLQTGATQQSVEVKENVIALETAQPDLGTTIEQAVVQELPNEISGGRGRQIDQFIFLAPGVTGSTFSHRINGGVDFESEVVFNGVPMAQSETQGFQTIWNPPFELISEFNVLRSSFSAQYGLAQGVVTYQTATGTNSLHGDGFEIIRNNFFDARGAYNATVPIDHENNYGFSVGGPVLIPHLYNGKNRTFFHFSGEWYRLNQTDTSFMSVPTAAEKAGDFSATGTTIYNPSYSHCTANGNVPGTPFVGNIIPSSCFSPTSASLLQYFPNPVYNVGQGTTQFANNIQSQEGVLPTRQKPWGYTIDHNISDTQSIHWTEWRDPQSSYGTETGAHYAQSNPLTSTTSNPDLGTVFLLNYSNSLTPHLVMTAGASWLGELNDQISHSTFNSFPAAPGAPQLPAINFSGPLSPTTVGSNWIESINRKLGWVIDNNYLWIHGNHTFNMGVEIRRTYQDDNECQQCAGSFNYSNNETANPAALGTTGNAFASFLLGYPDSADRIGSAEEKLRNRDFSPYIQDQIKLSPKLTVNFGVRWDIMVPFTAVGDKIVFFDSQIPNPGAGGLLGAATKFGTCAGCAGYDRGNIEWQHFSPRTGFSYELNNKTVLQGGFSMNFLDGGAYEYGTNKVAVNYGNLLVGSFSRPSTGTTTSAFGSWDTNILPAPAPIPFSPTIGNGTFINAFSKTDGEVPYDVVWSLGIQRELPGQMLISANYTGNRANHLPSNLNPINQLSPQYLSLGSTLGDLVGSPQAIAAGIGQPFPGFSALYGNSATVLQALRPYPQYAGSLGGIQNNFETDGSSLYNALQIQVEKRYSNGLSFLVSYNYSKMMSDTNSGFNSFANAALNKDNQAAEWTVDNNDQPQMINIAGTYELPFGPGKKWVNNHGFTGNVFGGWRISPLLTYASGTPLFSGTGGPVLVAGDPLGNECAPCNRANVVSYTNMQFSYSNVYKGLPVINAADFSDPGPWVLGNEPRVLSQLRNPFNYNENVAAAKEFFIGEHVRAKIEMEYFNLLNRVVFCGPDENFEDANFGKVINSQCNTQRQGQAHFALSF